VSTTHPSGCGRKQGDDNHAEHQRRAYHLDFPKKSDVSKSPREVEQYLARTDNP